jgi:hypothetical protein
MKYHVGDTGDSIEIGQYRAVEAGVLKGFFTLVIYSPSPHVKAQKILKCRYFIQGEKRWWSFPQDKIQRPNADKPDYIPFVVYMDRTYLDKLKVAVLNALSETKPEVTHGTLTVREPIQSREGGEGAVRSQTSFDWSSTPF